MGMSPPGNCHACDATLGPESAVSLWDGRDYCRSCVEAACPGLAKYAASHKTLQETEEWTPAADIWWNFKVWVVVLLLGGALVAAITVSDPEIDASVPGALVVFACICVLGEIMFILCWLWLGRGLRETASVKGGHLTITAPHWRKPLKSSLTECRWSIGKAPIGGLGAPPKGPRLVLQFPDRALWLFSVKHRSTFGSTPEMLGVWSGFLTLAGVERVGSPL